MCMKMMLLGLGWRAELLAARHSIDDWSCGPKNASELQTSMFGKLCGGYRQGPHVTAAGFLLHLSHPHGFKCGALQRALAWTGSQ